MVCSVNGSIAGRIDAWFSIEGIHFKTCIVSKAVKAIMLIYVLRLLKCISLKGIMRLRKFLMTINFLQRTNLKTFTQNLSHLLQLVRIICCKNKNILHF